MSEKTHIQVYCSNMNCKFSKFGTEGHIVRMNQEVILNGIECPECKGKMYISEEEALKKLQILLNDERK